MRLMLDTTFVIDQLRGDPAATLLFERLAEAGDPLYVCDVVVCETYAGVHPGDEARVDRLLRYIEFVQPGPVAAREAGRWRAEALRQGRSLSAPDSLVAAAADAIDAAVLTRNVRHFALTPVRVETY
jgi:predicted nucleic acid-binding protein